MNFQFDCRKNLSIADYFVGMKISEMSFHCSLEQFISVNANSFLNFNLMAKKRGKNSSVFAKRYKNQTPNSGTIINNCNGFTLKHQNYPNIILKIKYLCLFFFGKRCQQVLVVSVKILFMKTSLNTQK